MAGSRIYAHTLARARRILGSENALAERLGVSPAALSRYLRGEAEPPDSVFLRAVDILFNHAFVGAVAQRRVVRHEADARYHERERGMLKATARLLGDSQKTMREAKAVRAEAAATRISYRPNFAHRLFDPDYRPLDRQDLLHTGLDAALQAASTDLGNIQLIEANGGLRLAAWRGYADEFLKFFDVISEANTAYGLAVAQRRQVVIADVTTDALFAGTLEQDVLLAADVRAVCSTPLVTEGGAVLGMVSTHFHEPGVPEEEELAALHLVARGTATCLQALATDKS